MGGYQYTNRSGLGEMERISDGWEMGPCRNGDGGRRRMAGSLGRTVINPTDEVAVVGEMVNNPGEQNYSWPHIRIQG